MHLTGLPGERALLGLLHLVEQIDQQLELDLLPVARLGLPPPPLHCRLADPQRALVLPAVVGDGQGDAFNCIGRCSFLLLFCPSRATRSALMPTTGS